MKRKVELSPDLLRKSAEFASWGHIKVDLPKEVLRLVSLGG